VVSAATARKIARILTAVTSEGGTGVRAALQGYTVGGKTGTAQKADNSGTYATDRYVASFVGYAPVKRPAVAILVVVDEPRREHYGGVVAAPAFRKIAHETLDYLGISPQRENGRLLAGRKQGVQG
jgi:cell division protein FtsI (penicillin-binding protein 3)